MKIYPLIEAEQAADHNVKKTCELLEVSRAAFYERRHGVPSAKKISDAELTRQIKATMTSPRGPMELRGSTRSSVAVR